MRILLGLLSAAALLTAGILVAPATASSPRQSPQCGGNPAARDPANPLALPNPPGPNPLHGASFFVNGPRHGDAAGAIAQLLGLNPNGFPDYYSWARFQYRLDHGDLHQELLKHPTLAFKVHELEKIAEEPIGMRFSLYAGGGGPGAIRAQVNKFFCSNSQADPGAVPIFTTLFILQAGYCESRRQIVDNAPTFRRQINELAAGIGDHPAVTLLELDSVATSNCVGPGGLSAWESDLRYEVNKLSALPHTVVYLEAGYADANGPVYTAKVLNAIGIRRIRGFFTNDTHEDWTITEIRWGQRISQLTHGAHFIVNTAANGRGPLVPPNRVKYGNEVLCNPPGRGLGPRPTTNTHFKDVDAFMWMATPGNASGQNWTGHGCVNGGPPSGSFWPARAIYLAAHAQGKLGPGWPNDPY